MKLIRKDKITFVVSDAREKISTSIPKKRQIEQLNFFKETHRGEYATSHTENGYTHFSFSSSPGYSLAKSAKEYFKKSEKYIWVDRVYDSEDFIFVCIDDEAIVYETVVKDGEVDKFILAPIFETDNLPIIYCSSEIPTFINEFIRSISDIHENEGVRIEFISESILDSLEANKVNLYKQIGTFENTLNNSEKKGSKAPFIIIGVALVGFLIWAFQEDEPQAPVTMIDPYEGYKILIAKPSAGITFSHIYHVMKILNEHRRWDVSECEMQEGTPLVCKLLPSLSAKSSDLNNLLVLMPEGSQTKLINNVAHLIVPISSRKHVAKYQIAEIEKIRDRLYDKLDSISDMGGINILEMASESNWHTQVFEVKKIKTELTHLILVASATNGLPVNFRTLNIKRSEYSFSVEYSVTVYGGN